MTGHKEHANWRIFPFSTSNHHHGGLRQKQRVQCLYSRSRSSHCPGFTLGNREALPGFSLVLPCRRRVHIQVSSSNSRRTRLTLRRDKLRANLLLKKNLLEVDLGHVGLYNDELSHAIQDRPADVLPLFESAATRAAKTILFPLANTDKAIEELADAIGKVQITLRSSLNLLQFRDLTANTINKLVRVPGIVISASVLSSRATKLHLQCRACRYVKIIYPLGGMGGVGGGSDRGLPRTCDGPEPEGQKKDCPLDPFLIIHSKSSFADQQTLKLQEAPDMVPVGDLPKHMLLSTDRYLTGQVVPGTRVVATGIYSTFQAAREVSRPISSSPRNQLKSLSEKCRCSCDSTTISSRVTSRIVITCIGWWWLQSIWYAVLRRRGRRISGDVTK